MSLRDEFKDKNIQSAQEIANQKIPAFEREFDKFIEETFAKDFADWVLGLVQKNVRIRINNGHVSKSLFGGHTIVANELAIGPNVKFGEVRCGEFRHAFPEVLQNYLDKNPTKYRTRGGVHYKGLIFSAFGNAITVHYIGGLFLDKVKKLLKEKIKKEPGLRVGIHTTKCLGEEDCFYVTVDYKFVL